MTLFHVSIAEPLGRELPPDVFADNVLRAQSHFSVLESRPQNSGSEGRAVDRILVDSYL